MVRQHPAASLVAVLTLGLVLVGVGSTSAQLMEEQRPAQQFMEQQEVRFEQLPGIMWGATLVAELPYDNGIPIRVFWQNGGWTWFADSSKPGGGGWRYANGMLYVCSEYVRPADGQIESVCNTQDRMYSGGVWDAVCAFRVGADLIVGWYDRETGWTAFGRFVHVADYAWPGTLDFAKAVAYRFYTYSPGWGSIQGSAVSDYQARVTFISGTTQAVVTYDLPQ